MKSPFLKGGETNQCYGLILLHSYWVWEAKLCLGFQALEEGVIISCHLELRNLVF